MAISVFSDLWRKPPAIPGKPSTFPYTAETNPYTANRPWPPDFAQLSRKHQFRLERRFRRRTKLKWARPTWTKFTKLAQWGSIIFVGVYGITWLDMSPDQSTGTPLEGLRRWAAQQMGGAEKELGRRGGEGVGK